MAKKKQIFFIPSKSMENKIKEKLINTKMLITKVQQKKTKLHYT